MTPVHTMQALEVPELELSVENRLLLSCARLALSDPDAERIVTDCSGNVDWPAVLDGAAWHKLDGFLYRHLASPRLRPFVPEHVVTHLQERYRYQIARQMFFRNELKGLLGLLRGASIDVVLLKGAALVDEIYSGELGIRPMSDLDLLVRPEQASKADSLLRSHGYRPGVDEETQHQMLQVDRQLAALARPGSPVAVEIHTHLVGVDSPIRFNIDLIWDGSQPVDVGGVPAMSLKPEPLLASLAINYLKDRRFYSYSALGQLCDVSEVLRTYETKMDWSQFGVTGQFAGIRGVLFGTLYSAHHLLDAPVPRSVLCELTPEGFRREVAGNLLRDRVLGRSWVAKNLSAGSGNAEGWRLPLRMLRRVFLSPQQFAYRNRSDQAPSRRAYLAHNLARSWDALRIAIRMVTRPRRAYEDVSVDRWLNSLYGTHD